MSTVAFALNIFNISDFKADQTLTKDTVPVNMWLPLYIGLHGM